MIKSSDQPKLRSLNKNTKIEQVLDQDCDKCGHCCSYGTGFAIKENIKPIAKFLNVKEEELKEKWMEEVEVFHTKLWRPKTIKKPYGNCVFLKDKICGVHKVKPLQCRIGNCKSEELALWFMLNYQVNANDPESIREFASYLKHGGKTLEGGQLTDLVPDKEKLNKIIKYEIMR